MPTITLYPSGYVADDYAYASASNIENGYAASNSTSYAQINLTTGASAETYFYYTFDTSAIPIGAVITEVACTIKALISTTSSSYVSKHSVQLYSGTTAMGSATTLSTSASTRTLTVGTWSYDEIINLRLKLYAQRGSSSATTQRYFRFYGATVTISYELTDKPLGEKAVGDIVRLNIDNIPYEFIIVQQGNPDSSVYDSSCNGTWLLSKYLYTSMPFDSTDNDYANSDIHAYLNSTFISLLDSDVQSAIKQVKIPYTNGNGQTGTVADGASGLSTKVFLPSYAEVDYTDSDSYYPIYEGKALEYFAGADFNTKRGFVKGSNDYYSWWLRTSYKGYPNYVQLVGGSGSNGGSLVTSTSNYIRPMFILPSDFTIVNSKNKAIKGYVPVGGVNRELTGVGYANIDGIWKPLYGSYINIGGTWKQTF